MRRILDDITPPEDRGHRSIRKVSVDHTSRHRRPQVQDIEKETEFDQTPTQPRVRKTSPRIGLWIIALVSFLVLIFGFSSFFSGARLVITPKQRTVTVDAEFQAYKTPAINELGYEIMTIERGGSQSVVASGSKFVKEKSSGRIIIYNNFNSSKQRLIKNTRFETPEGLVYRINKSITVPGQKTENGKKIPGSIEVTVYADEEGSKYNIGLADFTIPGFKGDPRFDDFYARSKTEMTGGFIGEKKVVSESDENLARKEIRERLNIELLQEVFSKKPEGFQIYEDGIFIIFSSLSDSEEGGRVVVREKATLYGILFDRKAFAQFVAQNTIGGFEGTELEILDPNAITFTVLDKATIEPWNDDVFSFTLKGRPHIVWSFETKQLKEDLAGRSKDALQTVLTGYPGIDEAQIVLRPFWRQTFPDDIDDIKITTIIER